MKTSTSPIKILRAALLLLTMLLPAAAAMADNFITDVMVIGGTRAETNALKTQYQNQGWTFVNQDLNQGAGGDYIYLLYKTDTDANPDATFISDFITNISYDSQMYIFPGIMYYPVSYDGGSDFVASQGNLNNGTNGLPLYLYYTKETNWEAENPHIFKSITFNSSSEGAIPEGDFNWECGGNAPAIYMHPDITQGWMFQQTNSTECIITGYDGPKTWVTSYEVPNTHNGLNVTAVAAFSGFINLETLVFGHGSHVTQLPSMQGCTNFEHFNVRLNDTVYSDKTPPSMTSVPDYAFYGTAIENLTMPSVTQVGDYAFEGCNLSSVTFNQSNVNLGNYAFANISGNCTVTYPGSANDWSPYAYVYSPHLVVNASNGGCGWCGGANATSENHLYWTLVNGHLNIDWLWEGSPGQQVISSRNWNEISVQSLTLNHVYAIGDNEFRNYTSLTSVTIGNGVTSIGENAFYGLTGLTSVTIGNSVTNIGGEAFFNCSGLTSVTIGNSVTSIDYIAFHNCTGLTSVHISDLAAWCNISFNGSNPLKYAHHLYLNNNEITDLVIPNSVTSIKNEVFNGCTGLTSVTIPNNVSSIGEDAFLGCRGLSSVTIGNGVTSIGKNAFASCSSLKDLYFDGTQTQWNNVTKGRYWNYGVPSDYTEHWRCTVTFNANGHGVAPAPQTNLWSNESKATQPTDPTAWGYAFTGWYTNSHCTTPWNFSTDIVPGDMTLYAGWDIGEQGLQGSGTAEDPYLISNNEDWITFAQSVTDGMTYAGQTVKLTADISANVMAGSHSSESDYHAFSGTFNGDGHTITLTLSGSGHGTALFYHLVGATLKNLKVQGSVTTIGYRPATFASIVNGNSTISNCWSTVDVSSSRANDWVDGGGFVGRVSSNVTLNVIDCAFHGSVTFDSTATTGGGMVGYTQSNATVNLTNCLYSPTALTLNVSQYNPRIFVSGQVSGNLTNCYYNAVAAASVLANQGTDASNMTNEALATALGLSWTITDGLVVPITTNQYYISSAAEWNAFATSLNNGISFSGRTVTLTADIPTAEEIANGTTAVTTMAGTEATPFAGIFDGQGHTLTVSIVSNAQSIAPFRFADGATFKNLKIDGNIDASNKFAAGLLAETMNHSCTFINCISNVTLTSSVSGDGTHGGFVAYLHKGNTTFEGCAFTGKLLGANTTHSGGFVGFTDGHYGASVTITNCVFHPQQVTMSGNGSRTFARYSGSVTIGDNCYYSEAFGNAQGKQMRSITGGEYVTVAFNGNATPYELSGIDAYSVGIVFDSTLYAGNDETVSLNLSCTPPTDYNIIGYTATAGTLTGTANPYTLTMPNKAVTIQAVLGQPPVPYIDENGVEQQCTFYTVVTDTLDFYDLPAGWYVVNNDFTHNGPALFFGDAHLILCDSAMMNISYGGGGTAINTYGSLTLYGQSEGTGSLSATSNNGKGISVTNLMTINGITVTASGGDNQGIYATNLTINGSTVTATGSSIGISSIDLTINGSTVTSSANDDGGIGISANRVTINSGTVNATGNDFGIYIGNEYGYVTINGGTVTVTGDYGIYSPTVTLGWSILTDSITVGNFDYFDTPTVSVKSGQAFYYIDNEEKYAIETVVISGTLTAEEIEAIGGKTLRPYVEPCATPFDMEVTDIGATAATLHWMGVQDSYNVRYRPANRSVEWFEATADTTTLNLTDLEPETEYVWEVQGVDCDGEGGTTEWSEIAFFTTEELTTVTQTVELQAGTNWFSTYLDITLKNLQDALVDALPGATGITIKSKNSNSRWNGSRWRSANGFVWDVAKMYMVEVPEDCEIVLTGDPLNPAEHTITIEAGTPTWIGFPFSESKTFDQAIPTGFAVSGDVIKSMSGNARYTGTRWRGSSGLDSFEPGKGYMYVPASSVTEDRILIFPTGAK